MALMIEVINLVKQYQGRDEPAMAGVSLSVEPGEVFGLLGPNGACETTLISMICCLLEPDRGRLGRPATTLGAREPTPSERWAWCPRTWPSTPPSRCATTRPTSAACTVRTESACGPAWTAPSTWWA